MQLKVRIKLNEKNLLRHKANDDGDQPVYEPMSYQMIKNV